MNNRQSTCGVAARYKPWNTHGECYRIMLLTCWLEDDAEGGNPEAWRFRLEEPKSGFRRGCVGLQRLIVLLGDEIADEVVLTDILTDSTQ